MSILGDIEDGVKKVESEFVAAEHFVVKEVSSVESRIMVDLSHVEEVCEAWLTKNAPSLTGDVVAMKADFLGMLKGA
ncbi:MAG: hypothetical protein ACYDBI_05820 [Thermoplasmataceae archaeon]